MKQTSAKHFSENEPQMSMRNQSPFLFTSVFGLCTALSAPVVAQGAAPGAAPGIGAPTPATPRAGAPAPATGAPSTAQVMSDPQGASPADSGIDPPEAPEPLAFETELSSFVRRGALTSQEVARRALEKSARVEAKRATVVNAQAQADSVLGGFYPKLTGTARYTRLSDITLPPELATIFTVILNQYTLQATLTVPVSDYILRLSTALSGASKNKESAQFNERAERLLVQTEAKIAYYTWVKANGALYVAEQSKAQVDASLRDVKLAFSMGTQSKADVLRTEALVYSQDLLLMRAKQAVMVSAQNLRTVMHDSGTNEYFVGEEVMAEVQAPTVPSLEKGVEEARAKRLELRALQALEEATRDSATLAKVAYYPRLDLLGNAYYQNPNQRYFPQTEEFRGTWDASVILSWTPTDIPKTMGDVGVANSRAAEIAAQRQQLEDGLRVEIAQTMSDMETMLASIKTNREALKSTEEGFRVRNELFKAGRATTLEVTDAQTQLTQSRLNLVFAYVDARIAREKLLHSLGRDVPAESEGK